MSWSSGPRRCVDSQLEIRGLGCLTPSKRWWVFSDGFREEWAVQVHTLEEHDSLILVNGVEYRAVDSFLC